MLLTLRLRHPAYLRLELKPGFTPLFVLLLGSILRTLTAVWWRMQIQKIKHVVVEAERIYLL